jgi:hypothetical protein
MMPSGSVSGREIPLKDFECSDFLRKYVEEKDGEKI